MRTDIQTTKGPFKYYVIKILTILDPTHPVCNQTLLIKQTNFMLLCNHLAYPIHPPFLITYIYLNGPKVIEHKILILLIILHSLPILVAIVAKLSVYYWLLDGWFKSHSLKNFHVDLSEIKFYRNKSIAMILKISPRKPKERKHMTVWC